MCDKWQPIETVPEYKAVLTIHKDDLYPVVACRIGTWFFAETEGPEDIPIEGRHRELYDLPTHWMPLPEPPKVQS